MEFRKNIITTGEEMNDAISNLINKDSYYKYLYKKQMQMLGEF